MSDAPQSGSSETPTPDPGASGNTGKARLTNWIIVAVVVAGGLLYISAHRRAAAKAAAASGGAPAAGVLMTADSVQGMTAPNFNLTTLQGKPISLAQFKGHPVILDFWASWCGPCKEEIPFWNTLQKKYAAQGLQIIGISEDSQAAPVRKYLATHAMDYPVAMDQGALATSYGMPFGLPTTFFIGRNGEISARVEGLEGQDELQYRIQKIL